MKQWNLDKDKFGCNVEEFCTTMLRFPNEPSSMMASMLLGIGDERRVDVISPDRNGILKVIPASALPNFAKSGDLLPYLEPNNDLVVDINNSDKTISALKLRSWHSDMALSVGGIMHKCGLWMHRGDEVSFIPYNESANPNGNRDQFHIFRPVAPAFPLYNEYEKQIRGWTTLYKKFRKPAAGNNDNMNFDNADILSVDDLRHTARILVTKNHAELPVVTCVQWVHAVICLALCVPLNRRSMNTLGVEGDWTSNWQEVESVEEAHQIAEELPIHPYSRAELISAIAKNLDPRGPEITDEQLNSIITTASTINQGLADKLRMIPPYTLPPIHPLWDYRQKRLSTRINYEYIGTVFPDNMCIEAG